MKVQQFTNGSFVIHGITTDRWVGRYSAWFHSDGTLSDAEGDYGRYSGTRAVPSEGPLREWLRSLGPIWRSDVTA